MDAMITYYRNVVYLREELLQYWEQRAACHKGDSERVGEKETRNPG